MHTVLDLKTNGSIAEHDKTFEKRLSKTRTGSLLVHNDRTKLLRTEMNIELRTGGGLFNVPGGLRLKLPAYTREQVESYILTKSKSGQLDENWKQDKAIPGSAA